MGKYQQRINEKGIVSIIVVMIIIAIMTLITISFSVISRREQKQALDQQLSTQAFYAAESGVNQAVEALDTLGNDITDCNSTSLIGGNQQVDATNANIRYTCVLVDRSPDNITYTIKKDESKVVRIRPAFGALNTVELSWESEEGGFKSTVFAGNNTSNSYLLPQQQTFEDAQANPIPLPQDDFPNHTGILRATLTRASDATSFDSLLANSKTVLLYPYNGPQGTINAVPFNKTAPLNNERIFVDGACNDQNTSSANVNTPRFCNAQINNLNNTGDLYIRLDAIYKDVNVTIRAFNSNNLANPVDIVGAQAVIDSTGKAQDVLRRIQVRVPLEEEYYRPRFAVESMNTLCKSFTAWPGGAQELPVLHSYIYDPSSIYTDGEANNQTEDQLACDLPN